MKLRLSSFIGLLRLHHWMRHKSFCHLHHDKRAQSPVEMMKAKLLRSFLFFLLAGAAFQSPAQQSEADRKLLADVRAKAEKGDAQSQYELGAAFVTGSLGVAKDEAEAVEWFRKAAKHNNTQAQNLLGTCYYNGEGVAKDDVEAVKWYRKAAEQNDAAAQYNLGCCYAKGQGVAKDDVEAVKWFRKAAEQNDARAQRGLGVCYYKGQGVAKDEVEAVKWYRKAAEQNDASAQYNLGVLLRQWPRRGEGLCGGGEVVSQSRRAECRRWLNTIWAAATTTAKAWRRIMWRR